MTVDSVGRSMSTVSIAGTSTPSLNMSTEKITSSSPAFSRSKEVARGALLLAGVDSDGFDALAYEEVSHELRMPLGAAEGDTAIAAKLPELLQRIAGAGLGRDRRGQFGEVEL